MLRFLLVILAVAGIPSSSWARQIGFIPHTELLEVKQFKEARSGSCVFFHAWASWCQPCLKELPELITWLNGEKTRLSPLVVDLSTPFVQESFSKSYIRSLKPKFVTYLKPESLAEAPYATQWDSSWRAELPFSQLYVRGVMKKTWKGTVKVAQLRREVAALCK